MKLTFTHTSAFYGMTCLAGARAFRTSPAV